MSSTQPAPPSRLSAAEFWVLTLLTLAGAALRFYNLGEKSLWYDDAAMYHMVQGGWRDIVALNSTMNSGPPLYPLILGLLTGPGASEAMLRAPGALFSLLAIPLSYFLAREFLASPVALLVPLLMACAKTQIVYAQALREYSLTVSVTALICIAYVRFLRNPGARQAVWVTASAALGIATQYGIGILLAGLNLVCLVALWTAASPARAYRYLVLSQLPAAALAVLLVLFVVPGQMAVVDLARDGHLAAYYWNGSVAGLVPLISAPENDLIAFAFPGILMLLLTAVGTFAFLRGPGSRLRSGLATAFFVVPTVLTVVLAVAGLYPYGGIRQDIFLTAMLYVMPAIGLSALITGLRKWIPGAVILMAGAAATLALVLTGLQSSFGYLQWKGGRQPMRPLTVALAERIRPGETIYVYDGAVPAFRYYWRDRPEPWIQGATHQSYLNTGLAASQMQNVESELLALAARRTPFWVVVTHIMGPDAIDLWRLLERSATVEVEAGIPGTWLLRVTPRAYAGSR